MPKSYSGSQKLPCIPSFLTQYAQLSNADLYHGPLAPRPSSEVYTASLLHFFCLLMNWNFIKTRKNRTIQAE